MKSSRFRILMLFLICTAVSFFVRTCTYNREAAVLAVGNGDAAPLWYGTWNAGGFPAAAGFRDMLPLPRPNFVPYTVECAMMFGYASDVAFGHGVPEQDIRMAGMEKIPPYAQMNMALEWVLGWGYRALSLIRTPPEPLPSQLRYQDHPDFAWFVSVNVRLWTSLISGLIFLWLIVLKVPAGLAFGGGMLHAVSAAAVARATGQDIVRGDFCIPLILLSILLAQWILRKPDRIKPVLLFAVSFAAFAAWDLSRMLFGAWAVLEILRVVCGGRPTAPRRTVWTVIALAAVMNALFVPFNVTYRFINSGFICALIPVLMIAVWMPYTNFKRRISVLLAAALLLTGFWKGFIDNPEYRSNYSHFSAVMASKLKYHNLLPPDPEKMDYDSRIMWTPSMHSCTPEISAGFFPTIGSIPGLSLDRGPYALRNLWNFVPLTGAFFLLLLIIGYLFTPTRRALLRDFPRSALPILFTLGFIPGYIYIVRYHEFVILFMSAALPLVLQEYRHALAGHRRLYKALYGYFIFLLVFELFVTVCARTRDYSTVDSYMNAKTELIEFLRKNNAVKGKTVIADFTLGPMLFAYCGANIAMQPQFGMEPIRRPVEEFYRIMYHGTEQELSEFCGRYHAEYLIFDAGFAGPMVPYSTRYIACAREIGPETPVNLMFRHPLGMNAFYPVSIPRKYSNLTVKYRIYKVIAPEDRLRAEKLYFEANEAVILDELPRARKLIRIAWKLNPCSGKISRLYLRLIGRNGSLEL